MGLIIFVLILIKWPNCCFSIDAFSNFFQNYYQIITINNRGNSMKRKKTFFAVSVIAFLIVTMFLATNVLGEEITEETEKILIECCMKLFERLECRDYSRFDWRLDAEGNPKLLEVNSNPGWCWDGHLAKMAKYADISYSNMLQMILQAAEQRVEAYQR